MPLVPAAHAFNIDEYWKLNSGPDVTLASVVSTFLPRVLIFAGVIFFVLVILAGFGMITKAGSGDAHASEQAKAFLTYAVIGLVIIFAAYWIVQIISYVTGGSLKDVIG